MIKKMLLSFWFWIALLLVFIVIILRDEGVDRSFTTYTKHRMLLKDVNFSQMDKSGFEFARLYADLCDMDDSQTNMNASNVRVIFYNHDVATWSGRMISERGLKSSFEAKFWGDVRGWNTDKERFRTEEMRYYLNRKELHSQKPITIWKDDAVLTGVGFRYNTETKDIHVYQNVVIRIWENASETSELENESAMNISKLPIAPSISDILFPLNTGTPTATDSILIPTETSTSKPLASAPIRISTSTKISTNTKIEPQRKNKISEITAISSDKVPHKKETKQ